MRATGAKRVDPANIFVQANGFLKAQFMIGPDGLAPIEVAQVGNASVVISALASELYLKCIVCLETGVAPRGHYLKELFDRISPNTRRRICAIWDSEIVPMRKPLWDHIEHETGDKLSRDLPSCLAGGNKAFEKVRYAYEGGLDDVRYFLGDLPLLLRRVILEMRPGWAVLHRPITKSADLPKTG